MRLSIPSVSWARTRPKQWHFYNITLSARGNPPCSIPNDCAHALKDWRGLSCPGSSTPSLAKGSQNIDSWDEMAGGSCFHAELLAVERTADVTRSLIVRNEDFLSLKNIPDLPAARSPRRDC